MPDPGHSHQVMDFNYEGQRDEAMVEKVFEPRAQACETSRPPLMPHSPHPPPIKVRSLPARPRRFLLPLLPPLQLRQR